MDTLEKFARKRQGRSNAVHRLLDGFQLQQYAHLLIVQRIARRHDSLANRVGIGQHALLGLDTRQLALAQIGRRKFLNLKANPLLIAAIALGLGTQRSQLTLSRLQLVINLAVLPHQLATTCYSIDHADTEFIVREDQIAMLRMDIDQTHAQLAQNALTHGQIVDIRARFTRRGDHTTNGQRGVIVEIVLVEETLQTVALDIEHALDHAVTTLVTHRTTLGLIAEQQTERTEQDRLAGTRLTCDDIERAIELHFEAIDQHIIFNRERS